MGEKKRLTANAMKHCILNVSKKIIIAFDLSLLKEKNNLFVFVLSGVVH